MPNGINEENVREIALQILEGSRLHFTDDDIMRLSNNILILESRCLCQLNRRIIQNNRRILDTLAEHNFATELISTHDHSVPIEYEPPQWSRRPIDFRIQLCGITYWIQMKRSSISERDNRRERIINHIKSSLEVVQTGMFYRCEFSEQFGENDVHVFISFVNDIVSNVEPNLVYYYPNADEQRATIEFWLPQRLRLNHLTLGGTNDLNAVDVTGEDAEQMRGSLINAAGAFEWYCDHQTLNLIVIEADNIDDLDIGEALFGQELYHFDGQLITWQRGSDGFFDTENFSDRVAGVIAIRRNESYLISTYTKALFINDRFSNRISEIRKIVYIDRIVTCSDYLS